MVEEASEKQLRYIQSICEFLDIPEPEIDSKREASFWLKTHIPLYHDRLEMDSYEWEANHSDLVNNYGDWSE